MDELAQFKQTYFQECEELLSDLEQHLMTMQDGNTEAETLHAAFRAIHSIKGGAGAFGFEQLVAFAHTFETTLDLMRDGRLAPSEEVVRVCIRGGDVLADLVRAAQSGSPMPADHGADVLAALKALAGGGADSGELGQDFDEIDFTPVPADETGAPAPSAAPEPEPEPAAKTAFTTYRILFTPHTELLRRANEPLLLIRELKTLGAIRPVPDLGRLPALDDLDPEAAYIGWTIELETSRDKADVEEVFEFAAGDCDLTIEAVGDSEPPAAEEVVVVPAPPAAPEGLRREAPPPRPAPPPPHPEVEHAGTGPAGPAGAARASSIRVDLDKVDRLVNMVGELVITQAMLIQQSGGLATEEHPELMRGIEELSHHTRDLQESVMAIRAQPVKSVFQRIPRLVRETALACGKKVRLVTSGENTEIDKTVIEQLGDPLTHMIRNAVDHGIETPERRIAAGKPGEGTIHLSADHRGGRIVIEIDDDGQGIPRDKVLKKAVERGLVSPGVQLTEEEIDNLIFLPGFSTAEQVTSVSGRGVGMDVVRRNIQNLGGRVIVRSRPGHGSTFLLTLPLTLAVMDGMIVRAGSHSYVLPLANIIESLRPKPAELHRMVNGNDVLSIRGDYVQLIPLHRLFNIRDAERDPSRALVVMVETEGDHRVGLVVDEILGQQQVVIKSLEDNFDPVEGVAAATILGSGRVALILDVVGLKVMADRLTAVHMRHERTRIEHVETLEA
ncbi:MAG: chemotaxis protein CheA [Magnetospirillum sp. WYHS-4]